MAQSPLAFATAVLNALSPPVVGLAVGTPVTDLSQWTIWRGEGNDPIALNDDAPAKAAAQSAAMAAILTMPDPAAGLHVTCTSNSALTANYAVDLTTVNKIVALWLYVGQAGAFPAGQATLTWPDVNGVRHTGFTLAQAGALARAIVNYAATYDLAVQNLMAGVTPVWPATSVTIA